MNLVVGATGMVGGEVCRLLKAGGVPVRGLVRDSSDPAKVDALQKLGVETVKGDLRDGSSLEAACQGVTAVLTTVSAMPFSYIPDQNNIQNVDHDGYICLIDAAKGAGVKQFIYTSFTMDLVFPLRNAKRAVEKYLKESGLTYTIFRPSFFSEVWLGPAVGFDYPNAKVQVFGTGTAPISWISYKDVAQFLVASLDNPAARNIDIPLGGPQTLSPLQVVQIFEQLTGKKFEVQHVPEEALKAQQQSADDPMQQSFTGLMRSAARGDAVDMEQTLKTFPIKLTSVQDYAQRLQVTT